MARPFHFLTPKERGARLERTRGLAWLTGTRMIDSETGQTYAVQRTDEDAVARVVVSSEIMRGLGILAPCCMRVDFARTVGFAYAELSFWTKPTGAGLASSHGEQLAAEWPVDQWLGFLRFPRGVSVRALDVGLPSLLRWDLEGCMGGDGYRNWSWSELPAVPSGLAHARTREAPELGASMRARVGKVSTRTLARAIGLSGLTGGAAAGLLGPLLARQRLIVLQK